MDAFYVEVPHDHVCDHPGNGLERISDETFMWLEEHAGSHWAFIGCHEGTATFCIINETQRVHFKLRWG